MKTINLLAALSFLTITTACKKDTLPSLTESEKVDLAFLREEEKLARDVYNYAYGLYGQKIFQNIAKSEQSHMDAVLMLLDYYGLPDPSENLPAGEFSDPTLSQLYAELTAQCSVSFAQALWVGATIEDMDLVDIENFYSHTTKSDIISTYDLLSCGSRNHLRSFIGQLTNNGISYTPQFLTIEEYNIVISGSKENCASN